MLALVDVCRIVVNMLRLMVVILKVDNSTNAQSHMKYKTSLSGIWRDFLSL